MFAMIIAVLSSIWKFYPLLSCPTCRIAFRKYTFVCSFYLVEL